MNRIAALVAAAALLFGATACTVIEDGEVGVLISFGKVSEQPLEPGLALRFPVARAIETWNVKLQEIKETASVRSSEGLDVGLDASLLFRVDAEKAPTLRTSVTPPYLRTLVIPSFRAELRTVPAGKTVRNMYSEAGRQDIAEKVQEKLREALAPYGIAVENVLLRDVQLPERFKEAVEAKLTAEQKVQQKSFELQQAEKDAEIEIARARGAAKSQQIVRSTLSDSYLQYLWISTLNENPNVIYVATEANLPIFKPTQ